MKKNFARIIWVIVISLFIILQFYNFYKGNFHDIIISLLTVIILLLMLWAYYLLNKK